jgi:hypothetical protein
MENTFQYLLSSTVAQVLLLINSRLTALTDPDLCHSDQVLQEVITLSNVLRSLLEQTKVLSEWCDIGAGLKEYNLVASQARLNALSGLGSNVKP